MPSKNTESQKLAEQKKNEELAKQYLEAIREVDKKFQLTFQPVIKHEANGAIVPGMQLVRLAEEIKVEKAVTKAKK